MTHPLPASSPSLFAAAPWYAPEVYARKRPALLCRARALAALRAFFAARGVVEVETPALQVSPGLEPHLNAFATRLEDPFSASARLLYLHTSPEFAMKKLLAAGEPALFQVAHVFRNGERGPLHHPEFSMLEWYRVGIDLADLMDETEALVRHIAAAVGADRLIRRAGLPTPNPAGATADEAGLSADPAPAWERLSVTEAFARYAGVDLVAALAAGLAAPGASPRDPNPGPLAEAARGLGLSPTPQDRFEDVFFRIFLDRIEPRLGLGRPTILYGYPACMAALSRLDPVDPRFAERFEVYVGGLELANAFGELTDAAEQRARFAHDMDIKEALYGERYPVDPAFLDALDRGLPPCCGIALGFDRLVMLLTGAPTIEQVLWAPVADACEAPPPSPSSPPPPPPPQAQEA